MSVESALGVGRALTSTQVHSLEAGFQYVHMYMHVRAHCHSE